MFRRCAPALSTPSPFADNFVVLGQSRCALVIGAETMTRLLDWNDRATCVLFGDGAGAVVLEPLAATGSAKDRGILGFYLRADGTKQDLLYVDGGPSTTGSVGKLRMQGKEVFRHAVVNISEAVLNAADAAQVAMSEIDWFIPHQGQPTHHRGSRKATGHRPRPSDLDGGAACQHLRRLGSLSAGGRDRRRPHPAPGSC